MVKKAGQDLGRELETAARLAREAGELILRVYRTDFATALKECGDPVTEADRSANAFLVRGLCAAFPADGIVAEESEERIEGSDPGRVWYVDPLDGTKQFVERNGEFSVMIGLAVGGAAAAGVVYRPVGDVLYAGISGEGAWVERDGRKARIAVSDRRDPSALRMVVSRSHRTPLTDALRDRLGLRYAATSGSVGLKVGMIAEGLADLYLEPSSSTRAWDACGPEAVLRGAGGRFTYLGGREFRYGGGELRNLHGIAASCGGACHEKVLADIAPLAREAGLT